MAPPDADDSRQRLAEQVNGAARVWEISAKVASAPLAHAAWIDTLLARHQAALADDSFLAPTWSEIQAEIAQAVGPAGHSLGQPMSDAEESQLRELSRKINALLPPQYQGGMRKSGLPTPTPDDTARLMREGSRSMVSAWKRLLPWAFSQLTVETTEGNKVTVDCNDKTVYRDLSPFPVGSDANLIRTGMRIQGEVREGKHMAREVFWMPAQKR